MKRTLEDTIASRKNGIKPLMTRFERLIAQIDDTEPKDNDHGSELTWRKEQIREALKDLHDAYYHLQEVQTQCIKLKL